MSDIDWQTYEVSVLAGTTMEVALQRSAKEPHWWRVAVWPQIAGPREVLFEGAYNEARVGFSTVGALLKLLGGAPEQSSAEYWRSIPAEFWVGG